MRILIVIFLAGGLFTGILGDSHIAETYMQENYNVLWGKTDSLEKAGKYRSAWTLVNQIFEKAAAEKNVNQQTKSLYYQLKYSQQMEEEDQVKAIEQLEALSKTAYFPLKQICNSLLGDAYFGYYQSNRYRFLEREPIEFDDEKDIRFWSLDKIISSSHTAYENSITEASRLQKQNSSDFDLILVKQNEWLFLRPTLYDLLAQKVFNFYQQSEITLKNPKEKFRFHDEKYFSDVDQFVSENFKNESTPLLEQKISALFQSLLQFHSEENNLRALVDIDLQRLEFIKNQSDLENKQELLTLALKNLAKKVTKNEAVTEVYHAQAQLLQEKTNVPEEIQNAEVKTYLIEAVQLCDKSEKEFPNSYGAQLCKNLKNAILRPSLSIQTEKAGLPNEFQKALVNFKNLDYLFLKLIRIPADYHLNHGNLTLEEEVGNLLKNKAVHDWVVDLKNLKDYFTYRTETILPKLDKGFYALIGSDVETFNSNQNMLSLGFIWSSELSYTNRPEGDGSNLIKVLHRNSGKPITNATVSVYERNYSNQENRHGLKQVAQKTTDKNGIVLITTGSDYRNFVIKVQKGDDSFFPIDYLYSQRSHKPRSRENIHFFLDRAIYRPGQTVYFKALLTKKKGDDVEVLENRKVDFSFKDVNYQEISKLSLSTNKFGTVHGSFVIPTGGLTGNMSIQTSLGSKSFKVEEYKRPKFEVIHDPVMGLFKLNEEVNIQGKAKAYSGAAISNSKVSYRVIRKPQFKWYFEYFSPRYQSSEIAHGETETDDNGEFKFTFKAIGEIERNNRWLNYYNYEVETTVSDISGETQSSKTNVAVGNKALLLSMDVADVIYAQQPPELKIIATNLNQEAVETKGEVTLSRLKVPDNILKPRKWAAPNHWTIEESEFKNALPDELYKDEMNPEQFTIENSTTQKFDTEKDTIFAFDNMRYWIPGLYKLEMKSIDAFGEEVIWRKFFKVLEEKHKENVFEEVLFSTVQQDKLLPGQELVVFLSSGWKDLPVTVDLEHNNKIVECIELTLNKNQKRISFPVKDEYQGNFAIHISAARKNSFYQKSNVISVPRVDQQLNVSFETFRSVLLPGAKEEWKIKVSPERGDHLAAEMLASMYDASLDQFVKENWMFNLFNSYSPRMPWQSSAFSTSAAHAQLFNFNSYVNIQYKVYPYFNTFGYYAGGGNYGYYKQRGNLQVMEMAAGAVMDDAESVSADGNMNAKGLLGLAETDQNADAVTINSEEKGENQGIQIRSNFNETAFFYPDLQTDSEGNVIFNFTLPEALTKWNFRAFAHTTKLKFGFLNEDVIAQKKLMVSPNLPRFIREGDALQLKAKVDNLSKEDLSGLATLEILDATSMEPITGWLLDETDKDFSVDQDKNIVVSWELKAPMKTGAIAIRVTAKAGNFSDGEENILPLLTNRIFVTESEVFSLNKAGNKNLSLSMLDKAKKSKTLDQHAITLEYTPNPSWLVVKALPYLMEYPYDCAEQIYSRWYGNTLGQWIVKSKPEIKNVFEQWKNQPGALDSPLEKNQELKNLLIEETPWLRTAKNESESQRRIAQFFDENQMMHAQSSAIRKLKQMQKPEGGWPWFKGMQSNRYITQHILTGIGHLKHLNIPLNEEGTINEMTTSALSYVDQELTREFERLKKHNPKYQDEKHASAFHIQYLYMRSFFPNNAIPENVKEAFSYYLNNSQKYWLDYNIYLEAMIALSAERNENIPLANMIMESLKERSIQDEERGMFWKNYQYGYYWYNPGTETHALMVEAFLEIKNDLDAVRQLKIWLLKNKHTNQWSTTKATTEAVYAFLLNGADWLNTQPEFKIEVGGEVFSSEEPSLAKEAGSGYFKKRWEGESIVGKFDDLKIQKKDDVPSWGAVYWQYFEDMDKVFVTDSDAPVTITKSLFVERNTDQGPQLIPIGENEKINVGEKVVIRMKVTSEKDLEFVHLKDHRAAGFEPIAVLSGYRFQDGLGYYLSPRDAAMNFFIDHLPRGSFVIQYDLRANVSGDFSNGIANIQCMYAPEFAGHSDGLRIAIEP